MKNKPIPWVAISLLTFNLATALAVLMIGLLLAVSGVLQINNEIIQSTEVTTSLSACAFLIFFLLLPGAYYGLLRIMDREPFKLPNIRIPTVVLLILWMGCLGLGYLIQNKTDLSWLLLPPVNVAAIALPIWIITRLAINGLDGGSGMRRWGTFSIGMTLSPLLLFIAEALVIAAIFVFFLFWVLLNPGMMEQAQNLVQRLQFMNDENQIVRIVMPYLFNPLTILGVLGFFSVLVPVVEEAGKPLAVWLGANFIATPQQGFALGAISGAAYALVESLGNSASAAEMWQTLITARVGTDVIHIFNSALMGWALVGAWQNRKFLRLGLTYLLVIFIHGLWNAASLSYSLGSLPIAGSELPSWVGSVSNISIGILITLTIVILTMLVYINYRLRKNNQPAEIEVTINAENQDAEIGA
jgi:hypothetical protein